MAPQEAALARRPSMSGTPDPSFTWAQRPLAEIDLSGQKVAVVGGTDGLGRAIARAMADRGASVSIIGRTLRDPPSERISFIKADLSSMKEAFAVGRALPVDLDVLVLTTGIFAAKTREVTAEGVERDMAVSYLSRFAILEALIPRLEAERPSGARPVRVFVMGFPGAGNLGDPSDLNAERSYSAMSVHMSTVAANEALVLSLAKRRPSLRIYGLNPGLIKTAIRSNYMGEGSLMHRVSEAIIGWLTPTPEAYAERLVPLLFAPEIEARSGLMFGAKATAILPTDGMTEARVAQIMEASSALLARARG